MSEPFLAEVRMVGFNFAPRGYAQCDGQILPINQNQALFSLLGTTYGGDGRTSFGLPELRGRTPIHVGAGHNLGQRAGEANHQLTIAEIPNHDHMAQGTSDPASAPIPTGRLLADSAPNEIFHAPTSLVNLAAGTTGNTGNNEGHNNMQPFLAINFVIALTGLFPSRS